MSTTCEKFRAGMVTNSTASSFTAKAPVASTAKPSNDGVVDMMALHQGRNVGNYLQMALWGTAADNDTFDFRVWGWSQVASSYWVPQLLLEVNATVGAIVVTTGVRMVDTIVYAKGDSTASIISPANDLPASIILHLRGSELVEFDFDKTTAPPTDMNVWYRVVDQS